MKKLILIIIGILLIIALIFGISICIKNNNSNSEKQDEVQNEAQSEENNEIKIIFTRRKDLEVTEIYDTGEYKICTFGGNVQVVVNGETYDLKDALEEKIITGNDIIDQGKNDVKNNDCDYISYKDGGTVEYLYDNYTILKLNIMDGENDLVIGMKDSIMDSYLTVIHSEN